MNQADDQQQPADVAVDVADVVYSKNAVVRWTADRGPWVLRDYRITAIVTSCTMEQLSNLTTLWSKTDHKRFRKLPVLRFNLTHGQPWTVPNAFVPHRVHGIIDGTLEMWEPPAKTPEQNMEEYGRVFASALVQTSLHVCSSLARLMANENVRF